MAMRTSVLRPALAALVLAATAWAPARADDTAKADADAQNIFNSTCGWCHQGGGRVAGGIGPKLMATDKSDDDIVNRIKNGKEGRMPAFGASLSDAQIQALLRYIRNLKPES
jgi:mono/diheme cytochrome c family protein